MKQACRTFLAATLVALLPAVTSPAAAQDDEQPRWFGASYDDTAILAYGIPDSDYVLLDFSCRPGATVVKFGLQDEESDAGEGDLLEVSLATNGIHVEFSDKARMNQESGGIELHADLPLDETLRRILTSDETLEVTVGGRTQRYAKDAETEGAAARMFATCDAPKPAGDLDVTVTNRASLLIESLGYSEAGVDSFDSDAFGYDPLEPGASRSFTISHGRDICTFDISVLFAGEDEDEECCRTNQPAGTQDLCENAEFVVHD